MEKQAADRVQQWSGKAAFRVKDSQYIYICDQYCQYSQQSSGYHLGIAITETIMVSSPIDSFLLEVATFQAQKSIRCFNGAVVCFNGSIGASVDAELA